MCRFRSDDIPIIVITTHRLQIVAISPVNGNFSVASNFDPATFASNGAVILFTISNYSLLITKLTESTMYGLRFITDTSSGLVTSDTVVVSTNPGLTNFVFS